MQFCLVSELYFKKMKIIKIILSVIVGLSLVFFVTGLLIKETVYDVEVAVNKPIETVFYEFTEIKNSKNWIPDIKNIKVVNEYSNKIGNTYEVIVDNKGEEFNIIEIIKSYTPNFKFKVFLDAENMKKTNIFIFEDKVNHTLVKLRASCISDSYILGCVFPYFKSVFKKQDQTYLNNFKNYIESK